VSLPKGYTDQKCIDCGKFFPSKAGRVRCNSCFRDLANKPPEFFEALSSSSPPVPPIHFPPEFQERVEQCEFWLKIEKDWPAIQQVLEGAKNTAPDVNLLITSVNQSIQSARIYNDLAVKYLRSIENILECTDRESAWRAYETMLAARMPLEKKGRRGRRGCWPDLARKLIALEYDLFFSPEPPRPLFKFHSIPYPLDNEKLSPSKVTEAMAKTWEIEYEQCAGIIHGMKDVISYRPLPCKNKPYQKKDSGKKSRDEDIKKKYDGTAKSIDRLAGRYGLTRRRIRQIISE